MLKEKQNRGFFKACRANGCPFNRRRWGSRKLPIGLLFGLFINMMARCSNQSYQWGWYEVLPLEQKSFAAPSNPSTVGRSKQPMHWD
jgi:hypothetical protein